MMFKHALRTIVFLGAVTSLCINANSPADDWFCQNATDTTNQDELTNFIAKHIENSLIESEENQNAQCTITFTYFIESKQIEHELDTALLSSIDFGAILHNERANGMDIGNFCCTITLSDAQHTGTHSFRYSSMLENDRGNSPKA